AIIALNDTLPVAIPVLAGHMFVFYFGIVADITPPVALAAFAATGISGGKPIQTGVNASKLAIAAFIIPYMFVLQPELLMIDMDWNDNLSCWWLNDCVVRSIFGLNWFCHFCWNVIVSVFQRKE